MPPGADPARLPADGARSPPPLAPPQVHHAGASCPDEPARCDWAAFSSPAPNPQVLIGALAGGPAGPGDDTYHDKRDDYETNEVRRAVLVCTACTAWQPAPAAAHHL